MTDKLGFRKTEPKPNVSQRAVAPTERQFGIRNRQKPCFSVTYYRAPGQVLVNKPHSCKYLQ